MYKFKNRSYKNKVIQVISLLAVFSSLGAAQSKVKINTETEEKAECNGFGRGKGDD